jgi:hypothetical protein
MFYLITLSGVDPSSYPLGLFPWEVKQLVHEADHTSWCLGLELVELICFACLHGTEGQCLTYVFMSLCNFIDGFVSHIS